MNKFSHDITERRTPFAHSMERRRLFYRLCLIMADIGLIFAMFALTGQLYFGEFQSETTTANALAFSCLFIVIGQYSGLYSTRSMTQDWQAISKLATTQIISALLLTAAIFFTKSAEDFSRVSFGLGMLLVFPPLALVRVLFARWLRSSGRKDLESILIIDDGGPSIALEGARWISAAEMNIDLENPGPLTLDHIGALLRNTDRVIVSCPVHHRQLWAPVLRAAGVNGEVVSHGLQELGVSRIRIEEAFISLEVSKGPLTLPQRAVKRAMDLVIAGTALILLSPLFLVVAIAIKLDDGGPLLFKQDRVGRGNRFFPIIKFRTMKIEESDLDGTVSASREDNRITRVGAILRKTSIDELPQLLNVLGGSMSLVGPRPHATGSTAGEKLFWEIDRSYWLRHALKPGMTGLAQVRGYRGATEKEEDLLNRLFSDLEYVSNWNPLLDLQILARTAFVMIHRNAF